MPYKSDDNVTLYDVSIEFTKFSKRFDNVPKPQISNIEGAKVIVIEQNGRELCFNWDHVDYYSVSVAGRR